MWLSFYIPVIWLDFVSHLQSKCEELWLGFKKACQTSKIKAYSHISSQFWTFFILMEIFVFFHSRTSFHLSYSWLFFVISQILFFVVKKETYNWSHKFSHFSIENPSHTTNLTHFKYCSISFRFKTSNWMCCEILWQSQLKVQNMDF